MGHSNVINQVDGSPTNPYLFISCSDDETIKLWGVKDKVRIDVPNLTEKEIKKDKDKVVSINVTNEILPEGGNDREGEDLDGLEQQSFRNRSRRRRSRADRSGSSN